MAFTIPNSPSASDPTQAQIDSVDLDIIVAADALTGVVSGCGVTAQSTPDMTVAVAAGVITVAGQAIAVASGNVTVGTAHSTNPRFDLITVNTSGTKACTAGTAATAPVFPAIPANSVVLAAVLVPAAATTITSVRIIDKRVGVTLGAGAVNWGGPMSLADTPMPNTASATQILSTGQDRFTPILVNRPIRVNGLTTSISTGVGSSTCRMALYATDGSLVPGALLGDTGDQSSTSVAVVTGSITAITLAPGRYVIALCSTAAITVKTLAIDTGWLGLLTAFLFPTSLTNNRTYAAYPDPYGSAILGGGYGNSSFGATAFLNLAATY